VSQAQLEFLPKLPSSLRYLSLSHPLDTSSLFGFPSAEEQQPQSFIDACDWQCLEACTNLERLTLPAGYLLSGSLLAWVKAAGHLHVIDHEHGDFYKSMCVFN